MATEDGQDPAVPPVGEEIHLPDNTVLPMVMAAAIAVGLVGITTFIGLTVLGVVVFLITLVRWIRGARAELEELPPEHR